MFPPWEGGLEKTRLKVVREFGTKTTGIEDRGAGKVRRCPYSIKTFT